MSNPTTPQNTSTEDDPDNPKFEARSYDKGYSVRIKHRDLNISLAVGLPSDIIRIVDRYGIEGESISSWEIDFVIELLHEAKRRIALYEEEKNTS